MENFSFFTLTNNSRFVKDSEMVTNFNKTSFVSWTAIQKDRHAKKNKVNQFSCFIVGCLGKFLGDIFHDYKYFAPSLIT